MTKHLFIIIGFLFFTSCKEDEIIENDFYSGGETTFEGSFISIFQQPASNLSEEEIALHFEADKAFGDIFVSSPSNVNHGLGPLFNQSSCESCHVGNGASPFPNNINDARGLLIRISMEGTNVYGGPVGVPYFGNQLQTKALYNINPEAKLSWETIASMETFIDGEEISLTESIFKIQNSYLAIPSEIKISPRLAPKIIGLGLLEAISESDILKNADELDRNNDGISGKANYTWNFKTQKKEIGRFGWKASQPTLLQQAAAAYNGDMGITTSYFPNENCEGQEQCINVHNTIEVTDEILKAATFYCQSLAVPSRRNVDHVEVQNGKIIFDKLKCNSCHISQFTTSLHSEYSFLSNQKIHPYTDLLLHDMGNGLADNRSDYLATGLEWRTAPLWGLGLAKTVGGEDVGFLHDGRAKTIQEAILWHGGEAEKSKIEFKKLSKAKRQQLIAYLESL